METTQGVVLENNPGHTDLFNQHLQWLEQLSVTDKTGKDA